MLSTPIGLLTAPGAFVNRIISVSIRSERRGFDTVRKLPNVFGSVSAIVNTAASALTPVISAVGCQVVPILRCVG